MDRSDWAGILGLLLGGVGGYQGGKRRAAREEEQWEKFANLQRELAAMEQGPTDPVDPVTNEWSSNYVRSYSPHDQTGMDSNIKGDISTDSSYDADHNPNLFSDFLGWLNTKMDEHRQENFPTGLDPNDPFSSAYQGQFFDTGGIVPKRGLVDEPGGYSGFDWIKPWKLKGASTLGTNELIDLYNQGGHGILDIARGLGLYNEGGRVGYAYGIGPVGNPMGAQAGVSQGSQEGESAGNKGDPSTDSPYGGGPNDGGLGPSDDGGGGVEQAMHTVEQQPSWSTIDQTFSLDPTISTLGPDLNNNGIPDTMETGYESPGLIDQMNDMMNVNIGPDTTLSFDPSFSDPGLTLGLTHEFNTGGVVPKRGLVDEPGGYAGIDDLTSLLGSLDIDIGDNEKNIQLSDEDAFIRAQILGEDNPLYNYTIGGSLDDLIPGLSFEAGVRDDAVFGPGMMSPEDHKFLKIIKSF